MLQINKKLIKTLALHLSLMFLVACCLPFLFFTIVLPIITHQGQFVTVPNLKGMHLDELSGFLAQRNLRLEVNAEHTYDPNYPPNVVLQQYPQSQKRVKERRKIYVTLNADTPPRVSMPQLTESSVRNAQVLLKSQGLCLGQVKYIPDLARDTVLEQWYQGQPVQAGSTVPKGAEIDLVVGGGLGKKLVPVPKVVGMKLEEAKLALLGAGLKAGNIAVEEEPTQDGLPDTIVKQIPDAGLRARMGETVDVWIAPSSLEEESTPSSDTPILPDKRE